LPDHYLRLSSLKSDHIAYIIRAPFEKFPRQFNTEIDQILANEIQRQFERKGMVHSMHLTEVQIVCRYLFDNVQAENDLNNIFTTAGGVEGILRDYLERALKKLGEEYSELAISLLSEMVSKEGTRKVISQDDLVAQTKDDYHFQEAKICETLENLDHKAKLIRKERRRNIYYYEISSEFLVDWIKEKAFERKKERENRKLKEEHRNGIRSKSSKGTSTNKLTLMDCNFITSNVCRISALFNFRFLPCRIFSRTRKSQIRFIKNYSNSE
jgi:hypothetical protein